MSGPSKSGPPFKRSLDPLKTRMFLNDEVLSITINTKDSLQYYAFQTPQRLECAVRPYYQIGRLLRQVSDFELQFELSKSGRLHVHGTIRFSDICEYYMHLFQVLKDVCNIDIDTIDDLKIWKSYCRKDQKTIEPMFQKYKLPYLLSPTTKYKRWESDLINIRKKIPKSVQILEHDFRNSIMNFIEIREE